MNSNIRKISVGKGYPDKAIHYQIGQKKNFNGVNYVISSIVLDRELLEFDKIAYNIYIQSHSETLLWKQIIDMPITVECNIDFE